MSSAVEWYVARAGQQAGPYPFSLLVAATVDGRLRPDDHVWTAGMADWVQAALLPGLWLPPAPPVAAVPAGDTAMPAPAATSAAAPVADPAGAADPTPALTADAPGRRAAARGLSGLFVRHWRGELSLPVSYWCMGLLVNVGLLLLVAGLNAGLERVSLTPAAIGTYLVGLIAVLLALTAWQLVGIWRSAGRHVREHRRRFWPYLARIAVVLASLGTVRELATTLVPMLEEGAKLVAGIDDVPAHRITVRSGNVVELAGGMPFGTSEALAAALDVAPGVAVVKLESIGGRLAEGYRIYDLIKARGLSTLTEDECVSACTIAFLAGRKRSLAGRGRLGFHSSSFGTIDEQQLPDINHDMSRFLKRHGIPDWFVQKALSTRATSMWYPERGELLGARIVTDVTDE